MAVTAKDFEIVYTKCFSSVSHIIQSVCVCIIRACTQISLSAGTARTKQYSEELGGRAIRMHVCTYVRNHKRIIESVTSSLHVVLSVRQSTATIDTSSCIDNFVNTRIDVVRWLFYKRYIIRYKIVYTRYISLPQIELYGDWKRARCL